jgi:hypothetical protein
VNCVICGVRKARRACPGVKGDICSICCGTEREESIDCPLDCEYLRGAHEHEKKPEVDEEALPDKGVIVEEDYIRQYEWALMLVGSAMIEAYRQMTAITDFDAREALAALVKTYQTMASGLVYETTPTNPYAAAICERVRDRVTTIQARLSREGESGYFRDSDVLRLLIFLRRLECLENNGRKRSRAFLDVLNRSYVPVPDAEESLEPDEPRIIL